MLEKIKSIQNKIQSSKDIHLLLLISFPLLYIINYLFSLLMRSFFQVSNENQIVEKLYSYNGNPSSENMFIVSFLITVFYGLIYIYKLHNFGYSKVSKAKVVLNIFLFIGSFSFIAFEIYEKLKHEGVDIDNMVFNNAWILIWLVLSFFSIETMTNIVSLNINNKINKTILRTYFLFTTLIYFTSIVYLMFNNFSINYIFSSYISLWSFICVVSFLFIQYGFITNLKNDKELNSSLEKIAGLAFFWIICFFILTRFEYKHNIFNQDNWDKINSLGIFLFFFIGAVIAYIFETYVIRLNNTPEYSIAMCLALLIPNTNLNIFFLFPIVFIEMLKRCENGKPYLKYFSLFLLVFLFNYTIQHGGHFTRNYLMG